MPRSRACSTPTVARTVLPIPAGPMITAPRRLLIDAFNCEISSERPTRGQRSGTEGSRPTSALPTSLAIGSVPSNTGDISFAHARVNYQECHRAHAAGRVGCCGRVTRLRQRGKGVACKEDKRNETPVSVDNPGPRVRVPAGHVGGWGVRCWGGDCAGGLHHLAGAWRRNNRRQEGDRADLRRRPEPLHAGRAVGSRAVSRASELLRHRR